MPAYREVNGVIHTGDIVSPKSFTDTTSSATYDYYLEADKPNRLKSASTGWRRARAKKDGTEFEYARTGSDGTTATDEFIFPGPTHATSYLTQAYGED